MGIQRNLSEVSERVGNGTADFYDTVADNVKNFACSLWNDFPDQITQNQSLVSSFARGFMNRTCGSGGGSVPPPPTSQVVGGQCAGDLYRVFFDMDYTLQTAPGTFNYRQLLSIGNPSLGAIVGGTAFKFSDNAVFVRLISNSGATVETEIETLGASTQIDQILSYFFDTVRVDGQPDTCGDSPPIYPTTSPAPGSFATTINITSEDGDTLNYDLVYQPQTDVFFPMQFNFGGINVQINGGGINFFFGEDQLPDGQPNPLPPPGDEPNPVPSPKDPDYKDPFQPGDYVVEFPPNADGSEPADLEEQEEKEDIEEEVEDISWILVDVTTLPQSGTTITHQKEQDLDVFAGYFVWIIDTPSGKYQLPRIPLNKTKNAFLAPPDVTSYTAYTIFDAKIKISKYKPKPETE